MEWTLIIEVVLGVISLLLTVNAFFIVRLVKSIDKSNERSENLEKQMSVVTEKISQLPDLYQRILMLEKQVAVFEYVIRGKQSDPIS